MNKLALSTIARTLAQALACLMMTCMVCCDCNAFDIYVHPAGDDREAGNKAKPVATLARAQQLARSKAGQEPITVHVADGVYYLTETLTFDPADSGTEAAPVVYRAENEGGAILSGGAKLSLNWLPAQDGAYSARTPEGLEVDQLFVNGRNQRMARYPNYDASKKTAAYQGYSADAFSKQRATRWSDPSGGYIHAMHRSRWGGYETGEHTAFQELHVD
ncbi:MAG: hypothetical protein AAFV88_21300 [Planctomycetota bacterium]